MTPDQPSLEAELRALQAAALDEALLSRLEAAADGTLEQLTPGEIRFEEFLRGVAPAAMAPDFMAKLESTVRDVSFPVNEKILLFPKSGPAPVVRRKRPTWAAAAAVAFIGAATALMIPTGKNSGVVASRPADPGPAPVTGNAANFVPASFNRGVSEVHDEGVVWKKNGQPHSLVRVVYKDLITMTDAEGRTFQVEQPKVKYVLVPAKAD